MTRADDTLVTPAGDRRLKEEAPELRERLAERGVDPSDLIPGFRVTYRELDNICRWMRDVGWSGFIGLDEAVRAYLDEERKRHEKNEKRRKHA